MRSRDGFHLDRAAAELLLKDATYVIWRIEAAERFQAAMETTIGFCETPPVGSPDAILLTVRTFLRQEVDSVKRDRPDLKKMIARIRDVLAEEESR